MKWTNRHNLPVPLCNAIVRAMSAYTRGDSDWSITQLLKPPRQTALEALHSDDLESDIADHIWIVLGIGLHQVLENSTEVMSEQRLFAELFGKRISGQIDYSTDDAIIDYKTTTVWKVKDNKPSDEWVQQLNGYAMLKRMNNEPMPSRLEIVAILRDWSKLEASRDPSYPQLQVQTIDIPIWNLDKTKAFFIERVIRHEEAKITLPECSNEERWAKKPTWAVKKSKDAPRAVNGGLHNTETEAKDHAMRICGHVEFRPGANTRCDAYCSVSQFCSQYQALKGKKDE